MEPLVSEQAVGRTSLASALTGSSFSATGTGSSSFGTVKRGGSSSFTAGSNGWSFSALAGSAPSFTAAGNEGPSSALAGAGNFSFPTVNAAGSSSATRKTKKRKTLPPTNTLLNMEFSTDRLIPPATTKSSSASARKTKKSKSSNQENDTPAANNPLDRWVLSYASTHTGLPAPSDLADMASASALSDAGLQSVAAGSTVPGNSPAHTTPVDDAELTRS